MMDIYRTFFKIALVLLLLAAATGSTIMNYNHAEQSRLKLVQWHRKQATRNKINDFEKFLSKYPPQKEITNQEDLRNYTKEQLEKYKTEHGTMDPFYLTGNTADDMIKDKWGHELSFSIRDSNKPDFEIISAGEDGQFHTEDDISNFDNSTIPFPYSQNKNIKGLLSFLFPISLYAASGIILFWRFYPLICGKYIITIAIILLVPVIFLAPCVDPSYMYRTPLVFYFVLDGAISGMISGLFLLVAADIKRTTKDR